MNEQHYDKEPEDSVSTASLEMQNKKQNYFSGEIGSEIGSQDISLYEKQDQDDNSDLEESESQSPQNFINDESSAFYAETSSTSSTPQSFGTLKVLVSFGPFPILIHGPHCKHI